MDAQRGEVGPIDAEVQELLDLVAGTPIRVEVLSVLADATLDLRDLSDRLSVPRTTLRHNLQQLIKGGLVEETLDNEYRSTSLGRTVLNGLAAFSEHVETALRLDPLFSCLSPSRLDIDIRRLSSAKVVEATKAEPYAPHLRLTELVRNASTVRACFSTNPFLIDLNGKRIFGREDCDVSLLVTTDVADVLHADHQEELAPFVRNRQLNIGVVETNDLDYGLAVIDDRTVILGHDANGKPHALVETTDDACREWARDNLDRRRASATPLGVATA